LNLRTRTRILNLIRVEASDLIKHEEGDVILNFVSHMYEGQKTPCTMSTQEAVTR